MKLPIYLDYNSTTPVDPRVVEAMMPFFTESFGNSASRNHAFGWEVEQVVEDARESIGNVIGASGKEIVFTSGATESNNLAILGAADFYQKKGKHIITSPIEHKAVIDPCHALEQRGYEITFLKVDKDGCINLKQLEESIREDTILVSLMAANNEIGTINPLKKIGEITRAKGALFHTDATQAVGKIPIDVDEMKIDLLSMTAHKVYGPKGMGALYVRRKKPRVRLSPIMFGGGHERGMRSGTLNVTGIVGFAKALELSVAEMASEAERLTGLRQRLYERLSAGLDYIFLNGHPTERLPNNLNLSFGYVEGESLFGIKIGDNIKNYKTLTKINLGNEMVGYKEGLVIESPEPHPDFESYIVQTVKNTNQIYRIAAYLGANLQKLSLGECEALMQPFRNFIVEKYQTNYIPKDEDTITYSGSITANTTTFALVDKKTNIYNYVLWTSCDEPFSNSIGDKGQRIARISLLHEGLMKLDWANDRKKKDKKKKKF